VVGKRFSERVGSNDHACDICGHRGMVLTRSGAQRRGADRLNPRFDSEIRSYENCPECGVRYRIEDGQRV